jgi:hypothetical protein
MASYMVLTFRRITVLSWTAGSCARRDCLIVCTMCERLSACGPQQRDDIGTPGLGCGGMDCLAAARTAMYWSLSDEQVRV